MVKAFRPFPRRPPPGIKAAEHFYGDPVHVDIHRLYVVYQQGADEVIVILTPGKPVLHHIFKHNMDFLVGQGQFILHMPCPLHKSFPRNLQVAAGKKQAPDCILLLIQLVIYNLFINFHAKGFAVQQVFESLFNVRPAFLNQLFH